MEPVLGTCAVSDTRGLPGPSMYQRWRLCEHPFRGWGTRLYRADPAEASGPWCWSALPSPWLLSGHGLHQVPALECLVGRGTGVSLTVASLGPRGAREVLEEDASVFFLERFL